MKFIAFVLCIILYDTGCTQPGKKQAPNNSVIDNAAASEPPDCDCCVFDEAGTGLQHRLTIAPDTAMGERIMIRGIVYQSDGKTPAPGVQMYFYHTDHTGRYAKTGNEDRSSFAWWHGRNRGFLTTNSLGEYEINTIKPAPYPGGSDPAHIHCVVNAPLQKRCFNIADFVFKGDESLTAEFWKTTSAFQKSVGISNNTVYEGVVLNKNTHGLWEGRRDIILQEEYDLPGIQSGNLIGSESPAFSPQHAAGPDKGSHACPMCKYGYHPGVMVFLNTDEDWENAGIICKRLEEESIKRMAQKFKAYLIYTNPAHLSAPELEIKLAKFASDLSIRNMAITYVPSIDDRKTEMHLNKINPQTRTTIIVYNKRTVFDKFVDFIPSEKNFRLLFKSVDAAGKMKKKLHANKEKP